MIRVCVTYIGPTGPRPVNETAIADLLASESGKALDLKLVWVTEAEFLADPARVVDGEVVLQAASPERLAEVWAALGDRTVLRPVVRPHRDAHGRTRCPLIGYERIRNQSTVRASA